MFSSVIAGMNCPTRRENRLYPTSATFVNAVHDGACTKLDYAANAGDHAYAGSERGPASIADAEKHSWRHSGHIGSGEKHNGTVYQNSELKLAKLEDGTSKTYMIGEKYMDPNNYLTGVLHNDDQIAITGFDQDTHCFVAYSPQFAFTPRLDRKGFHRGGLFGSAHMVGCQFVFCDGSVRTVTYDIDKVVHHAAGVRNNHTVVVPDAN